MCLCAREVRATDASRVEVAAPRRPRRWTVRRMYVVKEGAFQSVRHQAKGRARTRCSTPPPHMTENLVHPPVLQYRAISRNIRLFWDALGVICAWVPLGLAGGVVRGVNGGRRARSRPNLAKFQNLRTPSGVDEL